MATLAHPGVYVFEVSSGVHPIQGVSTSTAAFIGTTEKGPAPGTVLPNGVAAQPLLVTSFTDFQRNFGAFTLDSFVAYAAKAFFDNGGQRLYIVRILKTGAACASLGGGNPPPVLSPPEPPVISAANHGLWGNNIWVAFTYSSDYVPSSSPQAPTTFKLIVMYYAGSDPAGALRNVVETYDRLTPQSMQTIVNANSQYIAVTAPLSAMPTLTPLVLSPASPQSPIAERLSGGFDGTGIPSYIGLPAPDNTVAGTGLHALDKVTDVNIIAIPGQGDPLTINAGVDYCKDIRPLQDCFFIADVGGLADGSDPRSATPALTVQTIAQAQALAAGGQLDSSAGDYGALYYPWVFAPDPLQTGVRNPTILLPPSGFMAGIYARIDNSRGVFKAPAGIETGVAGAVGPLTVVSDTEQDSLNPVGVNVLRSVPGSGLVCWGTRTFSSDSEWRYIPVRRMAIFLRTSIYYGIQWAVFEPNDEPLWSSLRLNIRSFMLTQFRAGAFQGAKPDDAFFVLCDATTTTQQDIDNGVVNILVGFAPLKPAEFVVLKLTQKVNQPAT